MTIQGKRLKDRLTKRVKDEQLNMKSYLLELAEQKAKDISVGFQKIRVDLGK